MVDVDTNIPRHFTIRCLISGTVLKRVQYLWEKIIIFLEIICKARMFLQPKDDNWEKDLAFMALMRRIYITKPKLYSTRS